jgi:hypothetical protein
LPVVVSLPFGPPALGIDLQILKVLLILALAFGPALLVCLPLLV